MVITNNEEIEDAYLNKQVKLETTPSHEEAKFVKQNKPVDEKMVNTENLSTC